MVIIVRLIIVRFLGLYFLIVSIIIYDYIYVMSSYSIVIVFFLQSLLLILTIKNVFLFAFVLWKFPLIILDLLLVFII